MRIQARRKTIILAGLVVLNGTIQPLLAQYAGGMGTVDNPFLIETAEQMNTIGLHQDHWHKHFKQIADIDLSPYIDEQFNKIGIDPADHPGGVNFSGTFDGNGYEIRNFIYRSAQKRIAIFEALGGSAELRNMTLVNPQIDCPQSTAVAGLAAGIGNSQISNCKVLGGIIVGDWGVGGLVAQCWAGAGTRVNIINCHVTSEISGNRDVGAVIGSNFGRVHNCSSSGQVSGTRNIGGLVGSNSYSPEWNTVKGEIVNSYSTCRVSGTTKVGGLCGQSGNQTIITHCYAAGWVTGSSLAGGLLGEDAGALVSGCFWDQETSGLSLSAGGTGLSPALMQNPATFQDAGWDLEETWAIQDGDYPVLRWESLSARLHGPTVYQAEDAVIQGGALGDSVSGYSGSAYVNLPAEVGSSVEWTVRVATPGTRTLCLHYANGTNQAAGLQISVNGVLIDSNCLFPPTGAWDTWNTAVVFAHLNPGINSIKLTVSSPAAGLYLDTLEVIDGETDLVLNRDLSFSRQEPSHPALYAIDANSSTAWIAQDYPQWIEIDLRLVHALNRSQLMCAADRAYQFKIEVRTSLRDPYVLVVDQTSNSQPGKAQRPIKDVFAATPARYVRLTVVGAHEYPGNEMGITEFSVFGMARVPAISIDDLGYPTIQSAVNAAQNGDVICLKSGLYQESITLSGKAVVLRSADPNDPNCVDNTIIQGDMSKPVLSLNNNSAACEIAGLTLRAGSVGVTGTATNATLRHCQIMDNLTHGLELSQASSPYLQHCLITANGGTGITMHATNGRRVKYCEPMLENCTIVDNHEGGTVGGRPVIMDSVIQGQ